jgi:hypothetical protein
MMITWHRFVLGGFKALEPGLRLISQGLTSWVPAVALITGIAFWHITADIEAIGPRLICAVACLTAIYSARSSGYFLPVASGGIAVIFNPFVPDMVSRIAVFGLYFAFAGTILLGRAVLKFTSQQPAPTSLAVQRRVALDCRK